MWRARAHKVIYLKRAIPLGLTLWIFSFFYLQVSVLKFGKMSAVLFDCETFPGKIDESASVFLLHGILHWTRHARLPAGNKTGANTLFPAQRLALAFVIFLMVG